MADFASSELVELACALGNAQVFEREPYEHLAEVLAPKVEAPLG